MTQDLTPPDLGHFKPSRRWFVQSALMAAILPSAANAAEIAAHITAHVPEAKRVGSGRYTFLGMALFEAQLFAPKGQYRPEAPFALKLDYLKTFKAEWIVDSSIKEIRKQGVTDAAKLAKWTTLMKAVFPDISSGAYITGVRDQAGHAVFFHNGRSIGTIKDTEFSRYFFGIWLSEKTSSAALRRKLLGGA